MPRILSKLSVKEVRPLGLGVLHTIAATTSTAVTVKTKKYLFTSKTKRQE